MDLGLILHLQPFKGIKLATLSFNHVDLEMGVLVMLFGPKCLIMIMADYCRFELCFLTLGEVLNRKNKDPMVSFAPCIL